jgi:methylated-DNA-protein-cysteine methyltransferase-like protein
MDFYEKVYEIVARIPSGKVTTYGAIARAIGTGSSARMVGWALNAAVSRRDLPCHRVVNRLGELSGARFFATPSLMRELLIAEGIEFDGERVRIEKHLWEI